jgi:tRNA 2-selenouridine synthase
LTFNPSLLEKYCIADVRTPLEFAEDHIPGAINIPLLSNEERIEIGILHKQQGPYVARVRGLELTAHKFPAITHEVAEAAEGKDILAYCWRGGLRSKTVATILELAGFKAFQLHGGYKAFRNHVSSYFEDFTPKGPLVVLHGMTGIGKTTLLSILNRDGESVIDLEGVACHRGSAFGSLGISQEHITQKHFETLLWNAFRNLPDKNPVFIEGESRRIGKLYLPGNLYEVMQASCKVWCTASIETRVKRLTEEYGKEEYRQELSDSLLKIKKKLGGEKFAEINSYLNEWNMEMFMQELIVSYYDKLYYKVREWKEDFALSMEEFQTAVTELKNSTREYLAARGEI